MDTGIPDLQQILQLGVGKNAVVVHIARDYSRVFGRRSLNGADGGMDVQVFADHIQIRLLAL